MQAAIQSYQEKQQVARMAEYEQQSTDNLKNGQAFFGGKQGQARHKK